MPSTTKDVEFRIRDDGTIVHQDSFSEYDWETVNYESTYVAEWLVDYINLE